MDADLRDACARAMHVLTTEGRTLRGGRATVFILGELGWRRTAWLLKWPPLVWLMQLGYWIVARNRRFFSRFMFRGDSPGDDMNDVDGS